MKSWSTGWISFLLGLAACGEPDVAGTPADGGTTPDRGTNAEDAGLADAAGGDAAAPDAATGPLTVRLGEGGFATGRVFFHDSTGALTAVVTASNGVAVAEVTPNSMVTAELSVLNGGWTPMVWLQTLTGVGPNEEHEFDPGQPPLGAIEFKVRANGSYPLASSYAYYGPCSAAFSDSPIEAKDMTAGCGDEPSAPVDLLAIAWNDRDEVVAYQVLEQQLIVANSTVTFNGPWLTDLRNYEVTLNNPGSSARETYLNFGIVAGGRVVYSENRSAALQGGASEIVTIPLPNFGDGTYYGLTSVTGTQQQNIVAYRNNQDDFAIDLSADTLAPMTDTAITPSPDPARPTLSWVLPPDSAQARPSVDVWGTNGVGLRWLLVMPVGQENLRLPQLPADLSSVAPTPQSTIYGTVNDNPTDPMTTSRLRASTVTF